MKKNSRFDDLMSAGGGSAFGGKKIFRRLWQAVVLGLGMSLALPAIALAVGSDVTFSADTTVYLSDLGINLTILQGSRTASYTVSTGAVIFNMESGSSVSIISTDKRELVNSLVTTSCPGSYSIVVLTSTTTQTVTVTPSAATYCGGSGGGGGGSSGVGGGGYSPPPPPPPPPPSGLAAGGGGSHPNGTLVLDGQTVYLIKDGKKLGFRNTEEFKSHGYNFSQVVAASAADKALLSETAVAKAMEGALVIDAADGKTVYMIGQGGVKRGFASLEAFKGLGYNFTGVPKIDLSDYPSGVPIVSGGEAHPEGALVQEGKTIWWIRGGKKSGFESMAVFNTYGFSLGRVTKANAADIALAQGSLVKFRDGTLVKDGNNYYIISDGKKAMFSSASDLTAQGYKTSNAISAGLGNY